MTVLTGANSFCRCLPACGVLVAACVWIGCGNGGGGGAVSPTATPPPTATPSTAPVLTPTPTSPPTAGAGVSSSITATSIDRSGQITVTFTLTDANGVPIIPVLSSTQNPQQASVRFTLAHVEEYNGGGEFHTKFTRYVNDVNATRPRYDSGGTLTTIDAATGTSRYTFATALPAGFDPTLTYSVGLQVDRVVNGQRVGANPLFDFVPSGGTPAIRQGTTTAQCNACHDPLITHGNRREVRLCTLCHTEAAVDPQGRSIDFRNMLHKIHRGKDLPSIVNGQSGATYAIYSSFSHQDVVFARKDANGVVTGVGFPRAIEACGVCHSQGVTAQYYRQRPAAAACASCHDNVNPSLVTTAAGPPGTNHFPSSAVTAFADGDCAACHVADQQQEFDISVPGAHVVPERSQQLAGLAVTITGVTNHSAGQTATIAFMAANNTGAALTDLSGLDRVAFTISGPTADYSVMLAAVAVGRGASGTLTGPDAAGVFSYTPTTAIPAGASGTWAVGVEARRVVHLATRDPAVTKDVEEAAPNQVATFAVDDSTAEVRRAVIDDSKCAACHGEFSKDFSIHGNLRNQTEYCVLCHNPNQSDVARRLRATPPPAGPTTPIDFKVMIHKIHTGEGLENKPYEIYGFGPAPQNYSINDFSEVRFPGDRRDCEKCHKAGTNLLPAFPGHALGTRLTHVDASGTEVDDGRLGPIRAVCTSCHDADDAVAHTATQTADDGSEACTVCHEEGREFAVSRLHAGRN